MQIRCVFLELLCLQYVAFLPGLITRVIVKQYGSTIVDTKYGNLRGSLVEFPKDSYMPLQTVEAYLGIQYAALRNNSLRFMAPTSPTERWNGIYTAWDHRPVCPQKYVRSKILSNYLPEGTVEVLTRLIGFTKNQAEECLNLNLYVPSARKWNETKLPVMIFVHGESYEVGTGNAYDGSVLASYGGVIVITVNYRLGVLGFLSTGDNSAEGNYALWDLLAILFWVKENIEQFGGDADMVTLFGHGHGAALVNMLLFTDRAADMDLFKHVILQSGSALSTWATSIDPVLCAQLIAKNVNCSHEINNSKALIDCFRRKSVDDLVRSVPLTPKYYTCFAPSVGHGGMMFPKGKTLEDLLKDKNRRFAKTKIMFGLTKKEAYSYLKQDEIEKGISESRKKQFIRTYVQNVFKYHRQKIYDILEHEYTQWDKFKDDKSRRDDIMDLISDGQYKAPLLRMAQEHAKRNDTYLYSFAYSTQSEDYPNWSGGVHGDELPYVFGAPLVGGLSPFPSVYTEQEMQLSKLMMRMWTNFAKTGDPNLPEWDTSSKERGGSQTFNTHVRWPKYNSTTQSYLHITTGRNSESTKKDKKIITRTKNFYRGKELALWLKLIPKLNHPDPGNTDASHELDNADNMSTFDDPTRLISKFHKYFPSPPPPPFVTPFTPPQSDNPDAYVSTPDDTENSTNEYPVITRKPPKYETPQKGSDPPKEAQIITKETIEKASVPLSVTVAIGCFLLFLNLLIFAGVYYQRKRIKKLRGENRNKNGGNDVIDNNKKRDEMPEAVNLVQTSETHHPKVSTFNHKSVTDTAPVYSSIVKPSPPSQGSGGYTYSALSQKSLSPMHLHNQTHYVGQNSSNGPPRDDSSQGSTKGENCSTRPPGLDKSPKVETRVKHIPRTGNHQITSNNAITIV